MAEKPKYDPNKPVEVVKPKKPAFNPEASFDVLDEKKKSTPSGSGVSPSPSSGSETAYEEPQTKTLTPAQRILQSSAEVGADLQETSETPQVQPIVNKQQAVETVVQKQPASPTFQKQKEQKQELQQAEKQTESDEYRRLYGVIDERVKASPNAFSVPEYFQQNESKYANMYLNDEQKVEYGLLKNIKDVDARISDLEYTLSKSNNPYDQKRLQEYKKEREAALSNHNAYKEQKYNDIDSKIAQLQADNASGNLMDWMIESNNAEIANLKGQKENFFKDQNAQIKEQYTANKPEMDQFKIPGKTPQERLMNYYLILNEQRDELSNKLAPDMLDAVRQSLPFGATDQEVALKQKLNDVEAKIQAISPILLINRSPIQETDGFFSSAWKSGMRTMLPNTQTMFTTENELASNIKASIVASGLTEDLVTDPNTQNIAEKAKATEAYTMKWWGDLAGNSLGMMPYFVAGSGIVTNLGNLDRLAKMGTYLKGTKYGKYLVAEPLKTGLSYEAAGYLMPEDSKSIEDATFLSGFFGAGIGGTLTKAINSKYISGVFNKLFAENADKAVQIVTSLGKKAGAGLGEYGEEVGNTVGSLLDMYMQTGDYEALKKDFVDQFGELSKNLELFIGSFVMGAVMGTGSTIGAESAANNKDIYNKLSPEEKKKADAFVKQNIAEEKAAQVEAKKEEIKDNPEAAKVEQVTEQDQEKKAEAIEVLKNPEATPEEKKVAAETIEAIGQKENEAEITQAAVEASVTATTAAADPVTTFADDIEAKVERLKALKDPKKPEDPPAPPATGGAMMEIPEFKGIKEGDVVTHGGSEVIVVKTGGKSRGGADIVEVKQKPKTKEQIKATALQNVFNKVAWEYKNKRVTWAQIEANHPSEVRAEIENLTALENSRTSIYTIDAEQWSTEVKAVESPLSKDAAPSKVDSKNAKAVAQEVISRPYTAEIENSEKYESSDVPVTNALDITKRLEAGETIYTYNEQTEEPIVVNDITEYKALEESGYQDWFAAKPIEQPITKIENEKPTTTTTPKKTSTRSNAKSLRQDAETSADKRPVKKVTKQGRTKRNQRKPGEIGKKALEYFPSNAKDVVMQWFIGGGRIKRSVIEDIYGKKADREFSTRVNLLDSESTNRTIQGTADELYALFGSEYENFNSEDYREALEEVISEYRHPNAMAKDLVKKNEGYVISEQDIKQAEYERGLYEASKSVDEETDNADVDNAIGLLETMSDEEIAAYVAGKDKAFEVEVDSMVDDWLNTPMEEDGETPWDEMPKQKLADKIRKVKIDTKGKAFDATLGLPIAVWNGAVELVAKAIESGATAADAIKRGLNYIQKNHRGKWNKQEFNDRIIEELGLRGISVNGEDIITKPVDKRFAEVVNGFYSDIEQLLFDTKKDNVSGGEWQKIFGNTDEAKWTGLTNWLSTQESKVSKSDIEAYLKYNRIQISEIINVQGGKPKEYVEFDNIIADLKSKGYDIEVEDYGSMDMAVKGHDDGVTYLYADGLSREKLESDGYVLPPSWEEDTKAFKRAKAIASDISYRQQKEDTLDQTKFSQYQLEGEKTNYKEILVTLPAVDRTTTQFKVGDKVETPYGKTATIVEVRTNTNEKPYSVKTASGDIQYYHQDQLKGGKQEEAVNFQSSHFDEENILVHLRMNTRNDADGNKILFLEEIQSDWGQQGKKQGFDKSVDLVSGEKYRDQVKEYELEYGDGVGSISSKMYIFNDQLIYRNNGGETISVPITNGELVMEESAPLDERGDLFAEYQQAAEGSINAIKSAPFVTDTNAWAKLGLKVALKEAVKQKVSKIAWTTGEQQNERYDLSKSVDDITIASDKNGVNYNLTARKGGQRVMTENDIPPNKLQDFVGKELAERAIKEVDANGKTYSGTDLKVGGKGMKGFYGNPADGSLGIVGNVAKGLFNQEPKTIEININKYLSKQQAEERFKKGETLYVETQDKGEYEVGSLIDVDDAFNNGDKIFSESELEKGSLQHSIDITPELKASVEGGLPLFSNIINALNRLKSNQTGKLNAFGILPEIWNTAIDGLILAVKAAKATADIVKAVDNFIKELKDKGAKFDEKEVRDSIEKSVGLKTETKAEEKPKADKPKEEPAQKEEPKDERRFTKQAIKEYPGIESVLDKDVIYYEKLPNKVTLAEANAIIEYLGVEEASKAFADVSNGMTWPVRNTVGQVLLKRLQAEGDYDAAIEVLENLTKSATELGQGIQALAMFKLLTPEGQLRVAQKEVNKQREKKRQKSKAEIDSIAEGIQQINEQAAEEAVDRVSGKVAAAETIKPKETKRKPEYGTKNKVVSKKRYDELKTKLKGKFFSGLDPELVEFAIYHAEAAGRKFGDFAKQMIADLGNKVKPYLKALYDQAQERLKDQYDDFSTEAEVQSEFDAITGKQVFPETKEKAKTDDKQKVPSVRSIVKSFYGSTKYKGQTLAKALEAELSLDSREAKDLADSIQREFDKLSKEKKIAMIEKIIGKSTDSQKVVDELVKLSGLGGMSYDAIVDAYADKMGWPKLTESNVKEITRLSEKVQSAPEGFKQFRAIEDLLKYQAGIKGLDKWDVPMAIWYANILSGYKTQFVNLASNLTNASGEWLTAAVQNPKTGVQLARAYWNGVFGKGLTEGAASFKTGYSPIRGKVEIPSVLERVTFMGGKFNPANYAKFVRRAMVAVDVVMFEGLKEMRAFQWANMMASESGVPPTEGLKKRAMEYMNENDTTVQEAQNQAQMEYESEVAEINASGLTIQEKAAKTKEAATDRKRRVYELIEKNRPDIIQTESQSFGARGTYNYKPEGVLGWAASILNSAGQTFPPFKFIVPFTNIIANVANEAINYTPWGFARGFSEGSVGAKLTGSEALRRKDWDSLSPKQQHQAKVDLITKAAIGTTLMTALMVLTQKWGDDDEPEIEITANGTGDYKKNYQLQETGWQPYSIRIGDKWISYQNSPLLVAFALVGNIRDYETYRKEKMTDEGLSTKIAIAANNTKSVLLDMTFLKGLNTFMQSAMSNETEDIRGKAMQAILNTGKNFVLPNIYTQAAKDIESAFGIPTKEVGATTFGSLLRDIPIARDMYFNKVNILGEPVIPDTDKFVSFVKESPLFTLLAEKKVFISPPSIKASTIIDPVTKKERLMTQEEFYKFATLRGEYIKGYLERNFEKLSKQSPEKVQEKIQRIQGKATINAKSEL